MLGTLMKYEFKSNGRILLPLFGAWIIIAVMLGLSLRSDGTSDPNTFMIALTGALYAFCTVAAVVITALIVIQRFYKNLLGNEGYFMFALPVSTGQHLTNKIISGAVWSFIGILVAIITALAIAVSIEGFQSVFDNVGIFFGDVKIMLKAEPSAILYVIEILVLVLIALAETCAKVYAAISIGHQWGSHRLLGAILAYVGLGIAESILGKIGLALFDLLPLDWYWNMNAAAQVHVTMLAVLALTVVMLAIYSFVSWILLDRKLNLE